MRRTSRFLAVGMVTVVAVAAPASLAAADDGNRGNGEAVWYSHGATGPGQWGSMASGWATTKATGQGTMPGVSDGVHEAKGNAPKEK